MKATCVLCGQVITGPEDPIIDDLRNRRLLTYLAIVTVQHINLRHMDEEQTVVDRSNFPSQRPDGSIVPNTIPTLIEASQANATLLTALSFLSSDDPVFSSEGDKMKDIVRKAIEQKQATPAISLA